MKYKIISILLGIVMFFGCTDMFDPAIENILEKDFMYQDATFAAGLLLNAYNRMPSNGYRHSDVATDNAVSNDPENNYRRLATGQWSREFNPIEEWQRSYIAIQFINMLIDDTDKVDWAMDELASRIYVNRFKGEAHGLRAYFMLYLMQNHAGYAADGRLMGVPILREYLETDDNHNIPRSTFEECMTFIYEDLEMAMKLLPFEYDLDPLSDPLFVENYKSWAGDVEDTSLEMRSLANAYRRVFGVNAKGKINAAIAEALMVRAKLFAASPAFSNDNSTTWEDAANTAGKFLEKHSKGFVTALAGGVNWFMDTRTLSRLEVDNPDEIVWRTAVFDNNSLESDNFPPTLYGKGRINPTQNLVDAFPMASGYPIDHPSSGYDPQDPYKGRDKRLETFIIINNAKAGVGNVVIDTSVDNSENISGLGNTETSTRTGYYLRKLLRMDVNLAPNLTNTQFHYRPHIRYTEMYLSYAEAANEAWGPEGKGEFGFSAYDVLTWVRKRAGISAADEYLESIRADKDAIRELIRNERRLELCFEDFRFWDLRRWKVDIATLRQTAKGVRISDGVYTVIDVEPRVFGEHMYYGPIPYGEILKYDALDQNLGW